ncbi:hypothetical protein GLOTRDRAFT_140829 [Gloeophyllum trabeum ATCC 11539]|uniref:Uncharacterized protein n=1 Tax=Gloeophyllum trabeum (strain ATCC 11539 / FP-39264 / Madison 617) TaxID=670483 RepID=S7PWH8_GLOTA|nr:uncharacterized protein GLOTRDRAFT_140829 [Gloeophyllum trabeum ATCC 11539]EPQ51888.1 hypothetical protein GLOTRDRAFT_140829 [Gloeophyllum trabeum ATCC 11539]
MSTADDPRDPSLERRLSFPRAWIADASDPSSASGMFLSGLVMVTKNRYLAWPNLLLAINSAINRHPLRTKDSANPPFSSLMLAVFALFASYFPMFLISPVSSSAQAPQAVPPPSGQ